MMEPYDRHICAKYTLHGHAYRLYYRHLYLDTDTLIEMHSPYVAADKSYLLVGSDITP